MTVPSEPRRKPHRSLRNLLYVIGGEAADRLEVLKQLFRSIPGESGVAFVVIQHLSPDLRSLMNELLARHTQMAIEKVENETAEPVKPGSANFIRKNVIPDHVGIAEVQRRTAPRAQQPQTGQTSRTKTSSVCPPFRLRSPFRFVQSRGWRRLSGFCSRGGGIAQSVRAANS